MDNHTHDLDTGEMILAEPAPVVEVTEAAVKIAQIESDRDIALAKIAAKQIDPDLEAENAAMRAELETLRALVAPPEPAPEPEPVVVVADPQDEPESEPDSLPEPELVPDEPEPSRKPVGLGVW